MKLPRGWANDSPQSNAGLRAEPVVGPPLPKGMLVTSKTLHCLLGLCAAAALASATRAQEDPDNLITASQQVDSGIALARHQISQADFPGAVATLERLMFVHPEAVPARLLYVSLLCRLDDRQGAELELGLLAGKPIADADWAEVGAACGAVSRPAAPRRKK
ncbi:MAG: hypothetical protein JWO25_1603 [Alphaproteobacteria bacterium]|nr:hypothetical protein [Alphaproteobacteria bacterium]MDB5720605.1 hypothetical protein [Alphaproteobacteria bacterium]